MKKNLLCLLLALAMLLSLAACGSPDVSSASAEETASKETEASAVQSVEEAVEETSYTDASSAEPVEASAAELVHTVEYPLSDEEITLTYWNLYMNNLSGYLDNYNDHYLNDEAARQTGVRLEWHDISMAAANENFNLLAASGDYLDFMPVSRYYTGGLGKALDDGAIIDLTEYVDEWAPDFLRAMEQGDTRKELSDDESRILQFYTIQDEFLPVSGLTVRQDWLDDLGLDVPETTDELFDVLLAIKNAHPECKRPFYVDKEGIMNDVYGAFDMMALSMEVGMMPKEGVNTAIYQKDGVAMSGLQQDGFREYLEYFHKIYDAGLTDPDFYSASDSGASQNANRSAGDQAIWWGNSDDFSTIEDASDDPNCNIQAIAPIVKNKGDTYNYGESHSYLGMQTASVMSNCEHPEIAVAYLNYFYSPEGYYIANYGIEGDTYELDDDGNAHFTDKVLANPEGMPTNVAMMCYTFSSIPTLNVRSRSFAAYLPKEIEAMEMWAEKNTGKYVMPTMNFTTDESNEYASIASDLYAYACQTVLQFIVGDQEINDQNWDAFQAHLTEMGIDRCVEIYQAALDRYNNR